MGGNISCCGYEAPGVLCMEMFRRFFLGKFCHVIIFVSPKDDESDWEALVWVEKVDKQHIFPNDSS